MVVEGEVFKDGDEAVVGCAFDSHDVYDLAVFVRCVVYGGEVLAWCDFFYGCGCLEIIVSNNGASEWEVTDLGPMHPARLKEVTPHQ